MKCKFVNGTKDNLKEVCDELGARGKMDLGPVITTVQGVIDDIRARGDEAVLEYTKKFDKAELSSIRPSLLQRPCELLLMRLRTHTPLSRRKIPSFSAS